MACCAVLVCECVQWPHIVYKKHFAVQTVTVLVN